MCIKLNIFLSQTKVKNLHPNKREPNVKVCFFDPLTKFQMQRVYKVYCRWTCLCHFHPKITLHSPCIFLLYISYVLITLSLEMFTSRGSSNFQRLVVNLIFGQILTLVMVAASYISHPRWQSNKVQQCTRSQKSAKGLLKRCFLFQTFHFSF